MYFLSEKWRLELDISQKIVKVDYIDVNMLFFLSVQYVFKLVKPLNLKRCLVCIY